MAVLYGVIHLSQQLRVDFFAVYKFPVPNDRRYDQKVDAFSAPVELLNAVMASARQRGMTKSGFIRYALAKEIGYSEAEARDYAEHRAVKNQRENPPQPKTAYKRLGKSRGTTTSVRGEPIIAVEAEHGGNTLNEGPPTDPDLRPRALPDSPLARRLIADALDKARGNARKAGTGAGKPKDASS